MKSKDKKAADVLDLLCSTQFDDVQIAYEVGVSVPFVKKAIKDACAYYGIRHDRDQLISLLESDFGNV